MQTLNQTGKADGFQKRKEGERRLVETPFVRTHPESTHSLISVVIPVFNEEKNIPELIKRCLQACRSANLVFELVLVDDGSRDGSAQLIAEATELYPAEVVGVFLTRNFGQHGAILAGFSRCRGDIVVTLDADLQNPPEMIPVLVKKAHEGYDVVGTVRLNRRDTGFRKLGSWVINKIVQKTTGVLMHDYGCMLRAYRKDVVKAMLDSRGHSTFIPVLANSFARTTTEIDVPHQERPDGESKYTLWKLINLQFDLLTSMTTFPLRVLSVIGVVLCAFGFGLGLFILVMRLWHGPEWAVGGVFTLFALLFFFIGMQFLGMGLLGEYLGRIYYDVRQRPRFLVAHVKGRGFSDQKEIQKDALAENIHANCGSGI
jgi:undecaprenyl-phosphate 4-deoxy-4-formamido-L-arabinose transferase